MDERKAIRQVIETAYIEGIHLEQDADKVRAGFHPGFRMLVQRDGELVKVDPETFLQRVIERRKTQPEAFEAPLIFEIPLIDVEKTVATVRIELSRGGTHLFTDYMLLYKFDEGWKIVSKAFASHS